MNRVNGVSPRALADLYGLMDNEQKIACLRLIANMSTADALFVMMNELPLTEQARFSDMISETMIGQLLPVLLRLAIEVAGEMPSASNEEQYNEINERAQRILREYECRIGELREAQLKASRDRKSDPETVKRNVEICDLRLKDRKYWSLGRLGRKYDISKRMVTLILGEEAKWRRLAQQGGSN